MVQPIMNYECDVNSTCRLLKILLILNGVMSEWYDYIVMERYDIN